MITEEARHRARRNPGGREPEAGDRGHPPDRAELEDRVMAIADQIQREWNRRMRGVDVHALRKTHRSWAQARGVPPVLIDKQLGHADPGEFEVMRALAGSETGRKHYLDLGSELFDAGRSAQAVRDLLDEAVNGLEETQPAGDEQERGKNRSAVA